MCVCVCVCVGWVGGCVGWGGVGGLNYFDQFIYSNGLEAFYKGDHYNRTLSAPLYRVNFFISYMATIGIKIRCYEGKFFPLRVINCVTTDRQMLSCQCGLPWSNIRTL